MNTDEIEEDTAVRETYEETGIEVELLLFVVGTFDVKLKHEQKTVIIYLAQPLNPDTCEPEPIDDENYDVRWWPLNALPEPIQSQEIVFINLINVVQRAFEQ
jgi:8-oxo-dGTP pyrophosphatase MutT (NUDIX family)